MSKTAPHSTRATPRSAPDVQAALALLQKHRSEKVRAGMARYGLPSDQAWGVSVGTIQKIAKQLGRDHALAGALWQTGVYEARLLAAFVGEPDRLTAAQMDHWCRDFDNWGVVDTVCFKLFDQSPLAWKRVEPWSKLSGEFQKRAGVVLLACLAGHDKDATDDAFLRLMPTLERAAEDERNFVKKGVSWAVRMIGRRSPALHTAAVALARRLAESSQPAARWIGHDALRDLAKVAGNLRHTARDNTRSSKTRRRAP